MDDIYDFINKYGYTIDKLQLYDMINHATSDCKEIIPLKLKKEANNLTGGDFDEAEIVVFLY
jgi:hypothetical protein